MKKGILSVRAKITLGYTLLVVLMIIIALTSIFRITTLVSSLQSVESIHGAKQTYGLNLRESVNERAALLRDIILVDNASEVPVLVDRMKLIKGNYDKMQQQISQLAISRSAETPPQEQELLKRIETIHQQSLPLIDQIIELRLNQNYTQAEQMLMGQARPLFNVWLKEINAFIDEQEKVSLLKTQHTIESAINLQKVMWGLLAISILLSLSLAFLLARSIARALGDEPYHVTHIAGEIASGNLAIDIPSENAMPGSVISAIDNMRDGLSHMIANVRESADHIELASEKIEGANFALSQRSEEQAESLEQIAQAMKHLTQIVSSNTQNARQATEKAQSTSEDAVKGGEVIHQMVTTMSSINDSSRKVSDITTVIDSIAFQTNILALNAAVEAARAGEHGRGFAVVASEVRSLAQRSATAAKEIATLINNSVAEVDNGNQLAMQASQSINDIVNSVHEVTAIISQITTSSETQITGISQVDGLIQQMNSITRMNVDMVKQANEVSCTLKEQVIGLGKWISAFKMKDSIEYKKAHPFFAELDSIEMDLEDELELSGKGFSDKQAHYQSTQVNSSKTVILKDAPLTAVTHKSAISSQADKPVSASKIVSKTTESLEVTPKNELHSELKRPKVYNLGGQEVKTPVGQMSKKKTEILSDHEDWEEF